MDLTDPEINLSIPLKPIYEEFMCPICYEIIRDCHMTHCSHNFCKGCIAECLNRKHQCPCCNAPCIINQVMPNKQFDRLISIIQEEKDKASREYFENLIGGGSTGSGNMGYQNQSMSTQTLSPIEQVFQMHMKKGLLSYEDYYQKLKQKFDNRKEEIRKKFTELMVERQKNLKGKKALTVSQDDQISKWKMECEYQVQELSESFEKSQKLLIESYDNYMKNFAPAPQFLPVTCHIHIPDKNLKFQNVHLTNTQTVVDVKDMLCKRMEQRGDPIVGFDKNNIFLLNNSLVGEGESRILHDENIPISQYQPEPGATLILQGKLRCKSDAPKQCFKSTFIKNANMKMDYYICKDCKLNWVCKSCAEQCHKGHNIVDYIQNHTPSWACCYCVKNGQCALFHNK